MADDKQPAPQGRERVTRPDTTASAPERGDTIGKPESPSTEAAKANGGVGEGNDLSQSDIKGQAGDARPAEERAQTGSRGPLSSDTASQLNKTEADEKNGDERSDAQKYADEKAEETAHAVAPERPDGKFPKVAIDYPVGVVATQITDARGRVLAYVALDHLDMVERENMAQFISAAINKAKG